MHFDLFPERNEKIEFPATGEGYLRRVVFYTAAGFAGLCGLAVVASLAVAAARVIASLLHLL